MMQQIIAEYDGEYKSGDQETAEVYGKGAQINVNTI